MDHEPEQPVSYVLSRWQDGPSSIVPLPVRTAGLPPRRIGLVSVLNPTNQGMSRMPCEITSIVTVLVPDDDVVHRMDHDEPAAISGLWTPLAAGLTGPFDPVAYLEAVSRAMSHAGEE